MAGVVAYDPRSYDPRSYDTGGLTSVSGASLGDRGARVWALQLELASGFPVSYPRTFDAAPLRLSSLDLTPDGTDLGSNFHEARILEAPIVVSSGLDEFGGVRDGETLRFRCTGRPPTGGVNLHTWVGLEHRGKPIDGWLIDLDPQTLVPLAGVQAFRGEILAMSDDPATVDILVRVFDVFALTQTLPTIRVDTSWAPYAPATGLGQVVPHGVGIGRRIRCPCVKARSFDDTLISVTATASAATDILTVAGGYDWVTGDGPLRVVSTGTLPAPLLIGVDYFAIAVDQDVQLRLATTRGNALAGTFVDLTSAGTGTLTVQSGIAPNLDDHTDFVVGVGNVANCQVWLDGETELPEWPLDYTVLTQEYRAGGRYLTVLRFPGDIQEAVVEADVLRVDPDVDGSSTLDVKFTRGFQDDARGWPLEVAGTDTGHLVRGVHRFRLGAWAPPAGVGQISLPPAAVQIPTRSVRLIWTAPGLVSAGDAILYWDGALTLIWRAASQALEVSMRWHSRPGDPAAGEALNSFGSETFTSWTATASLPLGTAADILVRVNDATGVTDLWLNGAPTLSHTKAGARQYFILALLPFTGPISGTLHRLHVRAGLITDDAATRAIWRWRRNGIDWLRELLETGGVLVDPLYAELAAANWHQIEAGTLVVDGWLTQETELRAAVFAVAIMRALWFTWTAAGVRINTPYAVPSNTARLGHGDSYGNLVALPTRTRASMTEAPRELQVRFRRQRTGDTVEFGQVITRPVFVAGATPLALELPFVDEMTSADIVCDWVTKRLIARDQLLRLEAGRDARDVQIGHVVTLNVPAMGIALDEAEVIGRERGAHRQGLSVVPFATAAFTYTPQTLPPDPLEPFFEPVSLGATPQFLVSLTDGQVRLEVVPANSLSDRPIGDALLADDTVPVVLSGVFSGISGPLPWGSFFAQVDDPGAADEDTTAVRLLRSVLDGGTSTYELYFTFPALDPALPIVGPIVIETRARAGAVDELLTGIGLGTLFDPTVSATPRTLVGGVTTYVNDTKGLIPGATGLPWTGALANGTPFGFKTQQKQNVYVTRIRREIIYRVPVDSFVHIRYLRAGPTDFEPPMPPASAAAVAEAYDFGSQIDVPAPIGTGTFWYWALVYDAVGRLIATLGPIPMTV